MSHRLRECYQATYQTKDQYLKHKEHSKVNNKKTVPLENEEKTYTDISLQRIYRHRTNKDMERRSASLANREMENKAATRSLHTYKEWIKQKIVATPNAGKGVEKLDSFPVETSYGTVTLGKKLFQFLKNKICH